MAGTFFVEMWMILPFCSNGVDGSAKLAEVFVFDSMTALWGNTRTPIRVLHRRWSNSIVQRLVLILFETQITHGATIYGGLGPSFPQKKAAIFVNTHDSTDFIACVPARLSRQLSVQRSKRDARFSRRNAIALQIRFLSVADPSLAFPLRSSGVFHPPWLYVASIPVACPVPCLHSA